MMNLSLYMFGAVYISKGKLAPAVGSLPAKPFGWGSSPRNRNLKAFLKSLMAQACVDRIDPHLTAQIIAIY